MEQATLEEYNLPVSPSVLIFLPLYYFPTAALKNYHKLNNLKQ